MVWIGFGPGCGGETGALVPEGIGWVKGGKGGRVGWWGGSLVGRAFFLKKCFNVGEWSGGNEGCT
jgi:hypothetical protein